MSILFYIVCWALLHEKGYQEAAPVESSVITKVAAKCHTGNYVLKYDMIWLDLDLELLYIRNIYCLEINKLYAAHEYIMLYRWKAPQQVWKLTAGPRMLPRHSDTTGHYITSQNMPTIARQEWIFLSCYAN